MASKDPLWTRVVLETNYKDANWSFPDDAFSYDDLVWHDESVIKPTAEEIDSQHADIVNSRWIDEHKIRRKDAYPSIDELVVALWEKLVEQDGLSSELIDSIQERRLAVKASNPKFNSKEDADTPLE